MKLSVWTCAILLLSPQQPQTVRGRIEGTVLREGTTEPISGAKVTITRVNAAGVAVPTAGTITAYLINPTPNVPLPSGPPVNTAPGVLGPPQLGPPPSPAGTPPQPPPIPTVTTDRAGKFSVPDLDEGFYRVAVTLNGYVKQEYGQRAFTGQGTTLTLTRGEVLKDLVVRMTRAGNISGRVTDDAGQPAPGVPIIVIKVTYNQAGIRLFQQAGTARTNDRGEYRLYWITPGRYYLAAGTPPGPPPGAGPGGNPSPNESNDPYTFTYYPGTMDQTRATAIDVKAGDELPMDFVVPRSQAYKISGRIVGAGGDAQHPAAVGISVGFLRMEGGSGFIQMSQMYDPATGNFELRNIVPGSYVLQANGGLVTARAAVDVVNADIANLTLTLSSGVNVMGKVQMAGGGTLPTAPVRIQLRPILKGLPYFVGFVPIAQANPADGTFRLDRVLAGEYRPIVTVVGHYVKDLRFENGDALNSLIELTESRSEGPTLEVILSPNVAQIDGVVTDDKNQTLPGVQAVLVPNQNRDRTDLFKAAATDQSGRFVIRDVAPGDYKLFAWDALDNFGYFEPDFIRRYESAGKAVHVDESAHLNIDTKVIPEGR